jgi:hypothetical protein
MITFVDQIGRTVIGKLVEETDSTIVVDNPVIIHVQPNPQNGQLQVQSFPYLFMEFISTESREKNYWTFNKASIATSSIQLDERIVAQYNNINTPPPVQPEGEPEVIKLFED